MDRPQDPYVPQNKPGKREAPWHDSLHVRLSNTQNRPVVIEIRTVVIPGVGGGGLEKGHERNFWGEWQHSVYQLGSWIHE